jgi:hypothetical protein
MHSLYYCYTIREENLIVHTKNAQYIKQTWEYLVYSFMFDL